MPVNSFRRSTLVHIVIDPCAPVVADCIWRIIQCGDEIVPDIMDIARIIPHGFNYIFDMAAV